MLILRRVDACPFVQIFDLGIKGYGLPLHPRILGFFTHFELSKIIENAWAPAPTLQDNSLYQLIIQTQPTYITPAPTTARVSAKTQSHRRHWFPAT